MKTFDSETLKNWIIGAEQYFIVKEHIEQLEELASLAYRVGGNPLSTNADCTKLDNLYEELFNENI